MCSLALRAHADLVTARADRVIRESATRETAHLLSIAQNAARSDTGALGHAYLLLCEAEAARASMTQSADPWTKVAAEWQLLECPYPAAYAQWRQAEELFGSRARAQGTRALAAALQTAATLGCVPLENSLRTLARHAGVPSDALAGSQAEASDACYCRTSDLGPAPGAADAARTGRPPDAHPGLLEPADRETAVHHREHSQRPRLPHHRKVGRIKSPASRRSCATTQPLPPEPDEV